MKRLFAIFFLCLSIALVVVLALNYTKPNYYTDYLRIHIRANSNLEVDQNIKYIIKDEIVAYLTPVISTCTTKKEFQQKLQENLSNIECISSRILAQNNFNYKASAKVTNEYFPARTYDNLTLESGYYDALIINLGSGEGNNWWCVVYPPLCFLNSNANYYYKSRIQEVIKKYFGG